MLRFFSRQWIVFSPTGSSLLCQFFSSHTSLRSLLHSLPLSCHMHLHLQPRPYQHTPRSHVRERPLHWCIIPLSLLFVLLLVVESVAFLLLGAWHLTSWRLRTTLPFAAEVHRREVTFGALLVLVGSAGILASILGLVAFFTLRLLLLRAVSSLSPLHPHSGLCCSSRCACGW